MKRIGAIVATLLFLAPWAAHSVVEIQPDVEIFQKNLESSLTEKLKSYLGNDTKFLIQALVTIARGDDPEVKKLNALAPENTLYEIGYVEVPFDIQAEATRKVATDVTAKKERFYVQSIEANLLLEEGLDPTWVEGAKTLVTQALKQYPSKVNVSSLPAKKPGVVPPSQQKDWIERITPFLIPLTAIFVSLILLVGLFLVSDGVKGGAKYISDGIRVIFGNPLQGKGDPQKPINPDEFLANRDLNKKDKPASPGLPPEVLLKDHIRNVEMVRKVLRENPIFFVQALRPNDTEWKGLRWLLPYLDLEEQGEFSKFLGVERMAKIESAQSDLSLQDRSDWLQSFVERLVVSRLQGGSLAQQSIGVQKAVRLYMANSESLLEAVNAIGTRAAWRILLEFLPSNRVKDILAGLEEQQWMALIATANIPTQELQVAVDQVLEKIAANPREDANVLERKKFFEKTLLEPVVEAFQRRPPGDDDEFLDQLTQNAPELAQMVRARVWTPRSLDRVPDAAIQSAFKAMSYEKRALVIIGLPPRQSERVQANIPAGNMRTIVMDAVKTLQNKADPNKVRDAQISVREFLSQLRRQAEAGQFQLKDEQGGSGIGRPSGREAA